MSRLTDVLEEGLDRINEAYGSEYTKSRDDAVRDLLELFMKYEKVYCDDLERRSQGNCHVCKTPNSHYQYGNGAAPALPGESYEIS